MGFRTRVGRRSQGAVSSIPASRTVQSRTWHQWTLLPSLPGLSLGTTDVQFPSVPAGAIAQ